MDDPLVSIQKLCSHNFSEKRSVRGFIRAGKSDGMADCESEGWGQGLEPWGTGPAHAVNDSDAELDISQLAQSICTRPPPGSKGQGKGKSSKGQGKGVKSSPGARKSPNLKPEEERAEPTTEEVKCPKCPNTCNWTTRVVCRSCGCKLPQGNVPKAPPSQKSAGPASGKTGGGGSSSGASSGTSYASVVKGETGPAENAREKKGTQQKKAESLEKLLATLTKDDPLREDLEHQLEQLRAALKDPRNPGARLDSANRTGRPWLCLRDGREACCLGGRSESLLVSVSRA